MPLATRLTLCLLATAACAAAQDDRPAELHAPFDALLERHVHDERVDYLAIRDRAFDQLTGYLDALAAADPAAMPRDARLAYYLNLYNATMIRAVCERLRAGYSPSDDDYGVFMAPIVRAGGGRELTLNELENSVIRAPEFDDPRIHAGLVCGAVSCPPLLPKAYTAANVDQLLEQNMRRFVRDPARNRIGNDVARLSKIFEWYPDDFGGRDGIADYVSRYAERDLDDVRIEFLEYSWKLNIAAPRHGRYVELERGIDGAPAGALVEVTGERGDKFEVRLPFGKGSGVIERDETVPFDPR